MKQFRQRVRILFDEVDLDANQVTKLTKNSLNLLTKLTKYSLKSILMRTK